MERKLYIGRLPELEKQLSQEVAAFRKEYPFLPVIVLVDNNLSGVYLRRRLAALGGSHWLVHFQTLADLAQEIVLQAGITGQKEPMPYYGEQWLSRLMAREAANGWFAPVADRPGFSSALLHTFQELEQAGLSEVPYPPGGDAERLAEMQRLFGFYRRQIQPYLSTAARLRLAAGAVPAAAAFRLMIFSCKHYTRLEREFLAVLAGRMETTVFWPEVAGRLKSGAECLDWYRSLGFAFKLLPGNGLVRSPTALRLLQQRLFNPDVPPAPAVDDQSLRIISAPESSAEASALVREIMSGAARGLRFGEMAVAVRDPSYAHLLADTFAANNIPVYQAGGVSLSRTAPGRGLIMFLEMAAFGYSRAAVMDLVSSAPFAFQRLIGRPVSPAFWDYLSIQAGVVKGKTQWLECLRNYRDRLAQVEEQEDEPGRKELIREQCGALVLLEQFLKILFEASEQFPAAGSWKEYTALCSRFLERFFAASDEQTAVLQLLRRLSGLDAFGEKPAFNEMRELLAGALQDTFITSGGFQRVGVNILPVGSFSMQRFALVMIPGLMEKSFPRPLQPDPFLPESEREALKGVVPLRKSRIEQDTLQFILAVAAADERLVLSWSRQELQSSREQMPSQYIQRVAEALFGDDSPLDQLFSWTGFSRLSGTEAEMPGEPATAVEYDRQSCDKLGFTRAAGYLECLSPFLARLLRADRSVRLPEMTAYQGMVGENTLPANEGGRPGGPFAVTALEDYARCPFFYFLRHHLELAVLEEPEEMPGLDARLKGIIIHRIAEKFYRLVRGKNWLPVRRYTDQCRELLVNLCEEQLARQAGSGLHHYTLLLDQARQKLMDILDSFLEREKREEKPWRPAYLEVTFKCGDPSGSLVIDLPHGEKIALQGRIDRIDRAGSRVRLIDYKTGKKKHKNESLQGGEALQLPVYLLAARRLLGLADLSGAVACYYHLLPHGVEEVVYAGTGWPEKERELKETLVVLYRGISGGQFFPFPGKQGANCRSCDFRSICGPGMDFLFRIKSGDSRLADFIKLKDNGFNVRQAGI